MEKLFTKKIWRLLLSFCIWNWIYSIISGNISDNLWGCIAEYPVHLWFMPVIIGLYLTAPLLRKIAADRKMVIYLICTGFLFSFCLPALVCKYPTMSGIQTLLSGNYLWWLTNLVYFATGDYLSVTEFSAKRKTVIYIAGGMSLLFLSAASNLASWRQKELVLVLKELSPLVFVFSAAVFIGVRDFCQKHSAFLERYSPQ